MKRNIIIMGLVLLGIILIFSLIGCVPKAAVAPQPTSRQAKVALVLGAGAAKGFAHIGVLKVLESQKIPIHMIVGTSVGSFVGAVYAYGYSAFQLQNISFSVDRDDLFDPIFPDNGFVKGDKLQNFINKTLKDTPIEKMKIPFYAIATDIQSGEEVGFARGNTGIAVRASCSIPGVFQPARISGRTYVDGGVVSPVSVDFARKQGADVVIAVDISAGIGGSVPQTTIDTILQSIDVMHSKISASQLSKADVVIKPKVGHIGSTDLTKRHEAVLEGEKAALAALPAIQQIVTKLKEEGRLP